MGITWEFGGIKMKAIFLVFIILAVTSVHSNKIKKKTKNDVSNENNDDDEFKSEESDRDLNDVQENLLSRHPRHGLRRSKRWVGRVMDVTGVGTATAAATTTTITTAPHGTSGGNKMAKMWKSLSGLLLEKTSRPHQKLQAGEGGGSGLSPKAI